MGAVCSNFACDLSPGRQLPPAGITACSLTESGNTLAHTGMARSSAGLPRHPQTLKPLIMWRTTFKVHYLLTAGHLHHRKHFRAIRCYEHRVLILSCQPPIYGDRCPVVCPHLVAALALNKDGLDGKRLVHLSGRVGAIGATPHTGLAAAPASAHVLHHSSSNQCVHSGTCAVELAVMQGAEGMAVVASMVHAGD